MNICFIQYSLSGGGAERKIVTLSNYFVSLGHSVEIGLFKRDIVAYKLDKRVKVTFIPKEYKCNNSFGLFSKIIGSLPLGKRFVKAMNKKYNMEMPLISFIESKRNCVYITMMYDAFGDVISILEKYNKLDLVNKYIVGECNNPLMDFTKEMSYYREKYYPKSDSIQYLALKIKDYLPLSCKDKSVYIPNPIRNDLIEPYFGSRNKTIVTYCRLNEQKNLPLLINAFAKLSFEYNDYKLEIYGKGELKDTLLKQINDFNISDKAFIYDFDPNIHEKIKKSAMFVSSSDYEGFGNSILEALAIGLPVVSTDCDFGPSDMIRDHENGLLVPCNNIDALYNAMKEYIENPELAEKCSQEGIKVREKYSIEKIGNEWLNLINELNK